MKAIIAKARANGTQIVVQTQNSQNKHTSITKQTRGARVTLSLSLSLSLSFSRAFFKTRFNTQNFKTHIQENSRKIRKFRQIFQIFTQNFTNFLIRFKDFKFLWIASAFSTPRNDERTANFLSTPRNDGVGANSRIYSSFAIARNDEWADKFAVPYPNKARSGSGFPKFHSNFIQKIHSNFHIFFLGKPLFYLGFNPNAACVN